MHNQFQDLRAGLPEYDGIGVERDDGKTAGEYAPLLYRKAVSYTHLDVYKRQVKNGSLQSVLDAALQGKGITYKIEDNIVYLSAPGEPQTPQQTGQEHTCLLYTSSG